MPNYQVQCVDAMMVIEADWFQVCDNVITFVTRHTPNQVHHTDTIAVVPLKRLIWVKQV